MSENKQMTLKADSRFSVPSPEPPGAGLVRSSFLLAGLGQVCAQASLLSSPAPTASAQLQLHTPAGLTGLRAVEGAEVVLPAWYTYLGETTLAQPPLDVLTLMWFLEQSGKDLKQVREERISALPSGDRGAGMAT